MAATPPERQAERQHRRETLLWIVLPMMGGGLLVAGGAAAAMLLPRRAQVSLLADWLLTILILCPVALCLLPVCVALITTALWMNRAHGKTAQLMSKIEARSHSFAEKALDVTETASKKSISLSAKLAYLDPLWRVFERKEDKNDKPNS